MRSSASSTASNARAKFRQRAFLMAANACQKLPAAEAAGTESDQAPSGAATGPETAALCAALHSTRGSETMPWFRSLAERPNMTVISPLATATAQKAKKARV